MAATGHHTLELVVKVGVEKVVYMVVEMEVEKVKQVEENKWAVEAATDEN